MRRILLRSFAVFGVVAVAAGEGENLISNGSFEEPSATARTPINTDARPELLPAHGPWERIVAEEIGEGGSVAIGVTAEIARTGKQALYVDYQKVTAKQRESLLTSKPIAVQGGKNYRASMWGQIDRERPISLDERRLDMWVEVHFLAPDGKTEVAESVNGLTTIPGIAIPAGPRALILVSGRWRESFAEFSVPEGVTSVRIYWLWTSGPSEGETDGVVFWDDASLAEIKAIGSETVESPANAGQTRFSPVPPTGEEFKQQ